MPGIANIRFASFTSEQKPKKALIIQKSLFPKIQSIKEKQKKHLITNVGIDFL